MRFGYCSYFSSEATFWQVPHLYGTVRLPVWGWPALEARVANALHESGVETLLHPVQYESDGETVLTEERWQQRVHQAAGLWKAHPGVVGMELLNEVNVFGKFAPAKAADWARQGFAIARMAGFTKPILVSGPARVGEWETYLRDMAEAGIPMGAEWSCHPYPQPLETPDFAASITKQIKTWRAITKRRPLHITETGIATGEPQGVGDEEQADRLAAIYRLAQGKGIRTLILFQFQDSPTSGTAGGSAAAFARMGVARQDQSFKPSYHRMKRVSGNA